MNPYDLSRFVPAQEADYAQALSEIKSGRKRTHWMWYVFPQIDGLAFSATSKLYAIKSVEEARAYLDHPVLGPRLLECAEAALHIEGTSAAEIFGSPDDLKLKSCATLFASITPRGSVFDRLLEKYYRGERDSKTLQLLGSVPKNDADVDLFAREMADVVRIAPNSRARVRAAPHVSAPRAKTPPPSAAPDDNESSEAGFVAPGVDRRELRKLKRGDYSPTGRLDLHGQTAAEAVASVKTFMDSRRHRCVCIVHGRGLHSAGNVSILKGPVRQCLRQHPATLAYADAPRDDGGSGAVYVLLRK